MRTRLTLLLFLALFLACGPSVHKSPLFEERKPHAFALLPLQAADGLRKERVRYVQDAITAELKNSGFLLLDSSLVKKTCKRSPECPQRAKLSKMFPLHGFIEVDVQSNSQNNFGLGFYNEVSVELRIVSPENKELISVAHTESKRGGVVFQSGQVIQGLKEQFANSGDDGFNRLADKLAKVLVTELSPMAGGVTEYSAKTKTADTVLITEIESARVNKQAHKICVSGTPHAIATLVVERQKSTLRETTSGKYCGIFSLEEYIKQQKDLSIELRSIFGNPVSQALRLGS